MKTPGTPDMENGDAVPTACAHRVELLALMPLLVFSGSAAISLGVWLLLCAMAFGGRVLCLLAGQLSTALGDRRLDSQSADPSTDSGTHSSTTTSTTSCLFFLIYALWAAIVIALVDTSHVAFSRALGGYLYLISCSAFILAEAPTLQQLGLGGHQLTAGLNTAESQESAARVTAGAMALLKALSHYGLLLVGFALLREGLYTGSLMRDWQLLLPFTVSAKDVAIYSRAEQLVPMAGLVPGGFFLLGLFIALLRLAGQRLNKQSGLFTAQPRITPGSAKRARVTEKL